LAQPQNKPVLCCAFENVQKPESRTRKHTSTSSYVFKVFKVFKSVQSVPNVPARSCAVSGIAWERAGTQHAHLFIVFGTSTLTGGRCARYAFIRAGFGIAPPPHWVAWTASTRIAKPFGVEWYGTRARESASATRHHQRCERCFSFICARVRLCLLRSHTQE